MKQLFTAALTLLTLFSFAQVEPAHKIDTVFCWRLVADTSIKKQTIYPPIGYPTRLVLLREVREWHNQHEGNPYWGDCMNCEYKDYPVHITYLTRWGTPKPKHWSVYETDQVQDRKIEYVVKRPREYLLPDSGIHWEGDTLRGLTTLRGDSTLTLGYVSGNTLGSVYNVTWEPAWRFSTGIVELKRKDGHALIVMDWLWLPRRLQKRFKKFYHLKP